MSNLMALHITLNIQQVNDKLRQQVLEGLGWNVFRIWSTDWWRSPEQELILLDQKIEELIFFKKKKKKV